MKTRAVTIKITRPSGKQSLWTALEHEGKFEVRYIKSSGELSYKKVITLDELNEAISAAKRHGYPVTDLMI